MIEQVRGQVWLIGLKTGSRHKGSTAYPIDQVLGSQVEITLLVAWTAEGRLTARVREAIRVCLLPSPVAEDTPGLPGVAVCHAGAEAEEAADDVKAKVPTSHD
jgi:hypothetical protein